VPVAKDTMSELFFSAVREAAGEEGVERIIAARGGREIAIPITARPSWFVTRLLGEEAASKICKHLRVLDADGRPIAGLRIYIASGKMAPLRRLELLAKILLCEGRSCNEVLGLTGLCDRTVMRHRANLIKEGALRRQGNRIWKWG